MYTYIWIIGSKNLDDFCKRRFGSLPEFVETIGHVSEATIFAIDKLSENGYVRCYLVFMAYDKGNLSYLDIEKIYLWDYEKIRLDKRTIGAQ